jgi:hypothetical protein
MDTLRIELYESGVGEIYDTDDEFPGESSNEGTHRTFLDNSNIQIHLYE